MPLRQLGFAALGEKPNQPGVALRQVAVPPLIRGLKDPDGEVRVQAILALGAFGPVAGPAVAAMVEALRDREVGLRDDAALALGRVGAAASAAVPAPTEAV
jgi:HEAT repeat protein